MSIITITALSVANHPETVNLANGCFPVFNLEGKPPEARHFEDSDGKPWAPGGKQVYTLPLGERGRIAISPRSS